MREQRWYETCFSISFQFRSIRVYVIAGQRSLQFSYNASGGHNNRQLRISAHCARVDQCCLAWFFQKRIEWPTKNETNIMVLSKRTFSRFSPNAKTDRKSSKCEFLREKKQNTSSYSSTRDSVDLTIWLTAKWLSFAFHFVCLSFYFVSHIDVDLLLQTVLLRINYKTCSDKCKQLAAGDEKAKDSHWTIGLSHSMKVSSRTKSGLSQKRKEKKNEWKISTHNNSQKRNELLAE